MRRRGYLFMVDVVAALRDKPRSTNELAADFGDTVVVPHVLSKLLRRLWDLRVLHVVEWRMVGPKLGYERVMALGDLPDAPPPRRRVSRNKPSLFDGLARGSTTPSAMTRDFAALWHALAGPCSRKQLVHAGVCHTVTKGLLGALKAKGLVRTADWDNRQNAGLPIELFQRGAGPDAPRPAPRPAHVYNKRRSARARLARLHNARREAYAVNSSIFRLAQGAAP